MSTPSRCLLSLALAVAVTVAVAACGGSSNNSRTDAATSHDAPTIDAPITATQACMDVAHAECAKRASCSNSFLITKNFPDTATCETRLAAECETALMATGQASTPASREACALDLPMADYTCLDLFENTPTTVCAPPAGSQITGAACGAHTVVGVFSNKSRHV